MGPQGKGLVPGLLSLRRDDGVWTLGSGKAGAQPSPAHGGQAPVPHGTAYPASFTTAVFFCPVTGP